MSAFGLTIHGTITLEDSSGGISKKNMDLDSLPEFPLAVNQVLELGESDLDLLPFGDSTSATNAVIQKWPPGTSPITVSWTPHGAEDPVVVVTLVGRGFLILGCPVGITPLLDQASLAGNPTTPVATLLTYAD